MSQLTRNLSGKRKAAYSVAAILLLALSAEIVCRCFFYHRRSRNSVAVVEAWNSLQGRLTAIRVAKKRGEIRLTYDAAWRQLFDDNNSEGLFKSKIQYQAHLSSLAQAAKQAGTLLVVMYLPSTDPDTEKHKVEAGTRQFFRQQAERNQLPFLDLTDELRKHSWIDVTMLPLDGHLGRFGNRIVARELDQFLQQFSDVRNPAEMIREDQVYGDLPPMLNTVEEYTRGLPFRLQTNRQGFRNIDGLYKKQRQRVLILGDSFTYGIHLSNHDTFPALLQSLNSQREIVNAGIPGYTISHELNSFTERSQYIAPDVTVLQVLDNDLLGLFLGE